jgi:hypothetical protein
MTGAHSPYLGGVYNQKKAKKKEKKKKPLVFMIGM